MKPTAAAIRDIIHAALPGPRIDWLSKTRCTIYEGYMGNTANSILCALQDTGHVDGGKEGYEYMRELGLVHHIYALRMGPVKVRIVSSPFPPRGMFSELKRLERTIRA